MRLRRVDQVIDTLAASGIACSALQAAMRIPREGEMSAQQKYWVDSKRYRNGIKPLHWVPKWTKTPHPRDTWPLVRNTTEL
jgi:hypothetical protein